MRRPATMDIKRIDLSCLPAADFLRDYFEPELPLILTGVPAGLQSTTRAVTQVLGSILRDNRVRTNKTWFQTDGDLFQEKIGTPAIVSATLEDFRSYKRAQNLRIWVNLRGNETPFHADVNGLFVFNYQVSGKKRWQIVQPDATVATHAFTQIAARKYNRALPEKLRSSLIEFDLGEGEMLFLPPYWYHRVIALDACNLNVNWVATKKQSRRNRLSTRESEIMAGLLPFSQVAPVRRAVDLLVGTKEADYFANYAGNGGLALVKSRVVGVSPPRALWRMCRELAALPRLAWEWSTIRSYQSDPSKALQETAYIEAVAKQ